jgi:predicted nucleic acid-binding protein
MNLYLDSSAAVKLFTAEAESPALGSVVRELIGSGVGRLFLSRLTQLETVRSLRRKGEDPTVADRFFEAADLVDIRPQDFEKAQHVLPSSLRSLDSLHLVSALRLSELGIAMVTYDRQLAEAAAAAGLRAISPGL